MAQLSYGEGVQLYEAGRYEDALEDFRRALSLFPSPNSRLSIAHCLYHLGRYGEAMAEYLLTEREAVARSDFDPRYRQTARAAQEAVATLRGRVGWITLRIEDPPPELGLTISGREIPAQLVGVPIPVTPGSIEVSAESAGFEPVRESMAIAPGERVSHSIRLRPLARDEASTVDHSTEIEGGAQPERSADSGPPSRLRIASWASYGLSGAGALVYGVFAALALVRYNHLEEVCGGTRCTQEHEESWSQGYSFFVVANVGFAVAAAALVSGVVMTVLDRRRRHSPSSTRAADAVDGRAVGR
jgi:hypothetical protein